MICSSRNVLQGKVADEIAVRFKTNYVLLQTDSQRITAGNVYVCFSIVSIRFYCLGYFKSSVIFATMIF